MENLQFHRNAGNARVEVRTKCPGDREGGVQDSCENFMNKGRLYLAWNIKVLCKMKVQTEGSKSRCLHFQLPLWHVSSLSVPPLPRILVMSGTRSSHTVNHTVNLTVFETALVCYIVASEMHHPFPTTLFKVYPLTLLYFHS